MSSSVMYESATVLNISSSSASRLVGEVMEEEIEEEEEEEEEEDEEEVDEEEVGDEDEEAVPLYNCW